MLLLCCLPLLLSPTASSSSYPHSFLPASSPSVSSFSSSRSRIQSSAWKNVRYWHHGPSQSPPLAPTFTTNTRTNNVDPGLVSSDWDSVVPSKLPSPPGQLASIRWPRFSPGVGDTMLTGQMKDRPSLKWSGASGDLFTIMILDEGIAFLNG